MKTTRRLAAMIAALGLVVGCAPAAPTPANGPAPTSAAAQPAAQPAAAPGITETTIKIGAWLPLSGTAAASAAPQRRGTETFFKMINDKGGVLGRQIDWTVEDNAYDVQRTVTVARSLVERDQVFAIVNANGTAHTPATWPYLLDEAKVPIFAAYGTALNWWDPPKENLYGILVPYEEQGRVLGRWAAKDGARSIVVVHNDPAAFENVAKNVQPGAETVSKDVQVSLLPVRLGTTDYLPVALQLAQQKPDAVVMILPVEEVARLTKELDRQGMKVEKYSYGPTATNDLLTLIGPAAEGFKSVAFTLPPNAETPAVAEYQQALSTSFPGEKPDFVTLFTFAQAKVFAEAMGRIKGPITRKAFTDALDSMTNYETGILPPISFSPSNHQGTRAMQRVQVTNGEWQVVPGGFVDARADW